MILSNHYASKFSAIILLYKFAIAFMNEDKDILYISYLFLSVFTYITPFQTGFSENYQHISDISN